MKTLFPLFTFIFLFSFSQDTLAQRLRGKGPIVEKSLNIQDFTGVHLSMSGDVYLQQGNRHSVRVVGQQNLIDVLNTEVEDGIWKIKFNTKNVNYNTSFKVYITMPTIEYAKVTGSGDMSTKGKFTNLDRLETAVSGSGDLNMDVECRVLTSQVSGSGDIVMRGSAQSANLRVSGSGDYNGYDLRMQNCEARVNGSGDIELHATETLVASVNGSGNIDYRGNPKVKARVTGSGDIDAY